MSRGKLQILEKAQGDENGERPIKKVDKHLFRERQEIYQLINNHRVEYPVEKMCKVFKISKSSYYGWLSGGNCNRWAKNENLWVAIKKIHEMSHESYGSPRIHRALKSLGFVASRPRIARIMKASGIRSERSKKFIATMESKHKYPVVENKLNPNNTYVRTQQGWLYLRVLK
jgi:hypothetical protein